MSRLARRNREDIVIKGCGGLNDIFDDLMKSAWRISDDEYDYILENSTDEELDLILLNEKITISEIKKAMIHVDKWLANKNKPEVTLVSHKGYWHLHRELNGKHYLGHADFRIGLTICSVDKLDSDISTREPKLTKSYTDETGELVTYEDEPYTESQIASFGKLTEEELIKWVERGT